MNEIIQQDFRHVYDSPKYDLLLVDPPYDLNKVYDGVKEEETYTYWVNKLVSQFDAYWKILFAPPLHTWSMSDLDTQPDRVIYWCKTFVQLRKLKWWQFAVTPILVYRAPDAPWYGPDRGEKRLGGGASHFDWLVAPSAIADMKPSRQFFEGGHPGVTGTKISSQIITMTTKEGDTVIDPMCGIGSIGVAAVRNKRNFVGIEINERYADAASKWIASEEGKVV